MPTVSHCVQVTPDGQYIDVAGKHTVQTVLSDHIKQDIFLAFQTGGCLLLNESSAVDRKICLWGFRPGPTQIRLDSHRR